MANRLKGITLEIGGDTTDLSKALQGVNKDIKGTQDQLKDVQKLLKMDPGNIELLRQKQKLLTDQVRQTAQKLEELKKAQAQMDASGVDRSSAEYMALQREIISTEHELENLQNAANRSNAVLEAVGAAASKMADGAKKVATATRGMSTAAAGALTAIGGMAYKAVTGADDLNTLAKQTGFSTTELQKFTYAADLVDVSVNDLTGAAKKLKSNMAGSTDIFDRLGVSVRDANGNMRDITYVFQDVLTALSGVQNEVERDQLAMEVFGKSADSLAGIIDDGGAALHKYGAEAEALGLIMSGDTLDSLNEVNDALDTLKARTSATLKQSGAKAMQAFLPVLERLADLLNTALMWLGSLNEEQITTIAMVLAIVAAISPIAGIIGAIASAVSALIPVITAINAAVMANPMTLMIAGIAVAVAGLTILIVKNWDTIAAATKALCDKIVEFFKGMVNTIKEVVVALGQIIAAIAQGFWTVLKGIGSGIVSLAKGIANGVISAVETCVNIAIGMVNLLISAINGLVGALGRLIGFGGQIPNIPNLNIPKFAKGGTLTSGTALVGEAGPELLTVAGGRATVTPLTNTGGGNNVQMTGDTTTTVNVQFSGSLAQLAAVLQPAISAETTRRGAQMVG